jgi:hypothetical protein
MAILIKCNEIHFIPGNQQTFRSPIEDGIAVIQGLEAFVWVNERSRARPWGNWLTMRGTVTSTQRPVILPHKRAIKKAWYSAP